MAGAGCGQPSPPGRGSVLVLLVVCAAAVSASLLLGSRPVPPGALVDAAHPLHAIAGARIDRTLMALCVGAALGVAGACLQGLTRNPLGDPGIVGINAGAAFAMVLAIGVMGVSDVSAYIWFGFGGAAGALALVHAIAWLAPGGATPGTITIAGAALTAALGALTTAFLLIDRATTDTFRLWQVGTLGGRDRLVLLPVLPFLGAGVLLAWAQARALDALSLGDDTARGLGARVSGTRMAVGAASALLAGGATALAGPIAFVGLLVPHVARTLVGTSHGRLLPVAGLLGAALVALADTLGRFVLPPAEVQVGIMTAVVGIGPFVWLTRRRTA